MLMNEEQIIEDSGAPRSDKLLWAFLVLLAVVSFSTTDVALVFMLHYRLLKAGIGIMMIVTELLLIVASFRTYHQYSGEINALTKGLILFTLLYNFVHIVYASVLDDEVVYLSLYGNPLFQPMFMVPLGLLIGVGHYNFGQMLKSMMYYTLLILPIFVIRGYIHIGVGVGIIFVLSFLAYLPQKWRVIFILFFLIYILTCYNHDARAALLRAVMGMAIYFFSLTGLPERRNIKAGIMLVAIAVPMYYLVLFATTGYSVFAQMETDNNVGTISVENTGDTRTLLYEELFEDLTNNDAWLLGKGLNSTYYSAYFDQKHIVADSAYRNATEVGFLNYLLKGGIIQAVLYLALLLIAIFNCYFRSNSRAMVLVGSILLAHYVLIFIEEIPKYDLYNIAIWICIGMSFSSTLLEKEDDFFYDVINENL